MSKQNIRVLYLNLLIKDGSGAIKDKLTKKFDKSMLLRPVRHHAAHAASEMTSTKVVAQSVAQSICRRLPKQMKEKGITVDVEEVFREGPFVVLQLQVIHVNTLELNGGTESVYASIVLWMLCLLGTAGYQSHIEAEYLPNLVMKQLADAMPAMLEDKMTSKKIEAETKVLKQEDQARYFFLKLKEIRDQELMRKNRNPIRKIRNRMSSGLSQDDTSDTSEDTEQ